jgi:hypothetical protein
MPSWIHATSLIKVTAPFTFRIGMLLSSAMEVGLLLVPMRYSRSPIFSVQEGRIRF